MSMGFAGMPEKVGDYVSLCKDLEPLKSDHIFQECPAWMAGKTAHAMEGVLRAVPSACAHPGG